MRLKECCIPHCVSCSNCKLDKLLKRNASSRNSIRLNGNCLQAVMELVQYLYNELLFGPSGIKDLETVKLIELIKMRIPKENIPLLLNLCEVAMNSIISRGLKSTVDIRRAYTLLGYYNTILDLYEDCETKDELYLDFYAAYLNVRFQVLHLTQDYQSVIKEYQNEKDIFTGESPLQRELVAHFTASSYLTRTKKHKITSRDVAEKLFEIVRDRYNREGKIAENDYYCLAKFLEHFIQEGKIQRGIDILKPFMDVIDEDEIESGKEALHKAIFHRDMFEALGKIDSDECESHYDKAQQIIHDFGIMDQQTKLLNKRKEVERYKQKTYYPGADVTPPLHIENMTIYNYSQKEAMDILQKIIESQEEMYEKIVHFMADEMVQTRGELQEIGKILKEDEQDTEGVLVKLKNIMNDGMETGTNILLISNFFKKLIPRIIEKWPEFEGIIFEMLNNS